VVGVHALLVLALASGLGLVGLLPGLIFLGVGLAPQLGVDLAFGDGDGLDQLRLDGAQP